MGKRGVMWKTPDFTADGLKLFACIAMLLQAVGVVIFENGIIHLDRYTQESLSNALAADSGLMVTAGVGSILQLAGGMAVPIFAFLLVEGFLCTSDRKKYLLAVALFALVSEVPYDWAVQQKVWDFSSQNAMVGTLVSLLMLLCLEQVKEQNGFAGGDAVCHCTWCSGLGFPFPGAVRSLYGVAYGCFLCVLYQKCV